jgi:hypothetical protein
MNKIIGPLVIVAAAVVVIFFAGKGLFVRTVNYEIAGLKIPSRYNILTGSIKPIIDYKGKRDLKTIETQQSKNIGLSDEQVVAAKVRWAIFEQWANSRIEYKGWQSDPDVFKRANEGFKKDVGSGGPKIRVVE